MKAQLDFLPLHEDIIDTIFEFQTKLGASDNPIKLYYPLDSLNRIFGSEMSVDDMAAALLLFSDYCVDTLGKTKISHNVERFCINIPSQGIKYARENVDDRGFLKNFLEVIKNRTSTIDDVVSVFKKFSNNIYFEKTYNNDEFDYLIYFADGIPSKMLYCIKNDLGGLSYHRFTKRDFDAFVFDPAE